MRTEIIVLCCMTFPFFLTWAFLWWHNSQSAATLRHYFTEHSKLLQSMKHIAEIFLAWVFGLFIPILTYLQIVYFITFADFVVGITAAILAAEAFSWRKASLLIAKFVIFTFLLAATYQIQLLLKNPPRQNR